MIVLYLPICLVVAQMRVHMYRFGGVAAVESSSTSGAGPVPLVGRANNASDTLWELMAMVLCSVMCWKYMSGRLNKGGSAVAVGLPVRWPAGSCAMFIYLE
jgi:hypothetical protein